CASTLEANFNFPGNAVLRPSDGCNRTRVLGRAVQLADRLQGSTASVRSLSQTQRTIRLRLSHRCPRQEGWMSPALSADQPSPIIPQHEKAMREALFDFVDAAESVIRHVQEPKDTVVAIEPLLRRLVTKPDLLKEKYRRPIRDKAYAQYLLYRPADHA